MFREPVSFKDVVLTQFTDFARPAFPDHSGRAVESMGVLRATDYL